MTRLFDIDGHLQLDKLQIREIFGAQASALPGAAIAPAEPPLPEKQAFVPENVWKLKGSSAYGAASATERIAVLDAMGVERQLVLPRVRIALAAWHGEESARESLVERFNGFMSDWQKQAPSRLYGTGILTMTDPSRSLREVKNARRLGLRALLLPCFEPPGGHSPASEAWEQVWGELADTHIAVVLHAGSEQRFLAREWTPEISDYGFSTTSSELKQKIDVATVDMFKLLTMHYGPQTFLTALIVGGVLARHPHLRFAIAELGAGWVEPYVDMLDANAMEFQSSFTAKTVLPSELLLRQVRVAPAHWEPVERYLANARLAPIYCFSTDFPHSEGGHQSLEVANERLAGLPAATINGYFSRNAELILGD